MVTYSFTVTDRFYLKHFKKSKSIAIQVFLELLHAKGSIRQGGFKQSHV